jgi:hypothetical protein
MEASNIGGRDTVHRIHFQELLSTDAGRESVAWLVMLVFFLFALLIT